MEIRNASYVNVSGLELTNDGDEADADRINGRNGILVIADLPEETTSASYNAEWKKSFQTSIHIDDCYVHDVNSSSNYKMSGGINFFGNIDDILITKESVTQVFTIRTIVGRQRQRLYSETTILVEAPATVWLFLMY